MAMFENFPYTDMHQLNLDWIIKIAKDFLDQYTHIQQLISDGETSLQNLTTEGLQQLQDKADALETLLQEWYDTHSEDIADQLAEALSDLNEWYTEHQNDISGELTSAIQIFNNRATEYANEVIETIPADYTELSNFVRETSEGTALFEDDATIILSRGNFQRNVFVPSGGYVNEYPYRISSRIPMQFNFTPTITVADGFRVYVTRWYNNAWTGTGWRTGTSDLIANEKYHFQIARVTEDESETADIDLFLKQVTIEGSYTQTRLKLAEDNYTHRPNDYLDWEEGGYSLSQDDKLIKQDFSDIRVRTPVFFDLTQSIKVFIKQPGIRVVIFACEPDGTYAQTSDSYESTTVPVIGVFNGQAQFSDYYNYKFAVVVIFNNLQTVPANIRDYVEITTRTDINVINGKQTLIYKFGGAGNDWCWVRTPAYYNQFRNTPYPFVICNHGNSWVMNGTPQYANWTKRTMYVPLDDPDYIANPSQYNGTANENLWYSNPTIEALLAAGYVVCGCENYGDNLYGNNNCRNACVDFFYHMINTYNVEDRCYMIGASNGALTTLNACYILEGKVKAIILQYPITCLVNQYQRNSNQRSAIRTAYGIDDPDITLDDLADVVITHDPLTTNVVDDIKTGYFPPTKIWYSEDDSIANYNGNTIPFYNLLTNSKKVVQKVEVSGEHGDYSHFDPSAFVAFFNAN